MIPIAAAPARECGGCTACCDGWLVGEIEGHEMKPGTPCFFRGERCCAIYDRRPQHPCRDFACAWLRPGSPFPEDFRPDRLGVLILEKRWREHPAYLLYFAGREPGEATVAWMEDFSRRTQRPFFYVRDGERFGFGPPEFKQEMVEKAARGERLY